MDAWPGSLFDASGFPPRWHCGLWTSLHGWIHIASDWAIFAAYVAIPLVLLHALRRRPDLPFPRVLLLFVLFILSCGAGHLMEATIFWWPAYRLAGAIKVVTALVSIATVVALVRVLPQALRLPGIAASLARLEREVEERGRAEASLRESEERYRTFVDASSTVVWVAGPDGSFCDPQASWEAYTGQVPQDQSGAGWLAMIHPDDRERFAAAWRASVVQARELVVAGRLWSAQAGAHHNFRCRAIPILDPAGAVREWLGAMHDTEEEHEAEARFQAVVEGVPNAIVMIGVDGRIALTNPAASRLFGRPREELAGQPVEVLLPVAFRAGHPALRQEYFASGPRKRALGGRELLGLRADGTEFPVEIHLNPLVIEGQTFALSVVTDISERKRDEEALRSYAAELEELNMQLESTKVALESGMAELERSNRALDDFAYVASHDLKEPLRGIQNYATFLAEDYAAVLDDEGRRRLGALPRLASRMDMLLESLLTFSRVGRLDLAVGANDLGAIVRGVLETLEARLEESGVAVRVPRPLPTVVCDGVRVGEVFHNLVTNAIKYRSVRDPWIEIGWDMGGADGPELYVRDNGIGIAPKHHETIFAIFKRLHGRDEYGGGAGAGLTIAKEIVARHGGRIWVESALGAGSTFRFTLRAEDEA